MNSLREANQPMASSRRDPPLAGDPTQAAWLGRLQDTSFSRAARPVRDAYPPQRRMTGPQLAEHLARRTYALASSTRPDGRAHAAPTLFSTYAEAFWLPTLGGAARIGNVKAHPWLALSIVEGEHDTHAAVLAEGPAEMLATVPEDVRTMTELRNRGGTLDWSAAWLRMTPQRLFSFAELAWQDKHRTLATDERSALAKDGGDGTGSHRLMIGGDAGPFADPDGFEWEAPGP